MIMTLEVDVTAERRHYNIHCRRAAIRNPRAPRARQTYEPSGPKGPVNLKNLFPMNPMNPMNPHVRILHRMRKSAEVGP